MLRCPAVSYGIVTTFYFFVIGAPFCPAEHRSCWRNKTLDLSEPPQAVSFQRPVNSEKRKAARRAGTAGYLFWFVFGQAANYQQYCMLIKMNNSK
ncbi:MAG: hypothetical protein AMJ60_09395 [Desulfobacterales bacterium SG8_35]|nr:MAG: hypothetical protein AMJ60_09395 [Desulfobacterales bacterium SG8_35]